MTKEETLAWLRRISGDLATATLQRLEDSLPWYAEMPPARRSAVGLVAQAGITSFIQWYDDPHVDALDRRGHLRRRAPANCCAASACSRPCSSSGSRSR